MSNKKFLSFEKFQTLQCYQEIRHMFPHWNDVTFHKEYSESMTLLSRIRVDIQYPFEYNIVELCAGSGLTSVLAAYLGKFELIRAYDLFQRKHMNYDHVRGMLFHEYDIYHDWSVYSITEKTILLASHSCGKLATRIIDIWNQSCAKMLVLIPCCHGHREVFPLSGFLHEQLGTYKFWVYQCAQHICRGTVSIYVEPLCLSPKNCVIIAKQ